MIVFDISEHGEAFREARLGQHQFQVIVGPELGQVHGVEVALVGELLLPKANLFLNLPKFAEMGL